MASSRAAIEKFECFGQTCLDFHVTRDTITQVADFQMVDGHRVDADKFRSGSGETQAWRIPLNRSPAVAEDHLRRALGGITRPHDLDANATGANGSGGINYFDGSQTLIVGGDACRLAATIAETHGRS